MAIESHLPSRENPSPAQSQRDATSAPQTTPGRFEARETDLDVPNKEIAKPAITVTGQDGKPIPEAAPETRSKANENSDKTDIGSGY